MKYLNITSHNIVYVMMESSQLPFFPTRLYLVNVLLLATTCHLKTCKKFPAISYICALTVSVSYGCQRPFQNDLLFKHSSPSDALSRVCPPRCWPCCAKAAVNYFPDVELHYPSKVWTHLKKYCNTHSMISTS